jgi:hypothetical protein
MRRVGRIGKAVILLLGGLPLAAAPLTIAHPAFAQTLPGCPPGYYYASDGYCYPGQPPPVYAYPPPIYDPTPPVYQPPTVVDGVALGVGLGLLFGALAAGHSDHDRGHERALPPRHSPPPRGHR